MGKPFNKVFKKKTEVVKLFEREMTEAGKSAMMTSMVKKQQTLATEQARH